MAVREIITWPDTRLRVVSEPVKVFDNDLSLLQRDMIETMKAASGIGLAAIQVAVPLRMITIDIGAIRSSQQGVEEASASDSDEFSDMRGNKGAEKESKLSGGDLSDAENGDYSNPAEVLVLVNPEYLSRSRDKSAYHEGCLSFPDFTADVVRNATCIVEYLDHDGAKQQLECDGLLATCVQHEMDHLNGKMFFQRIDAERRALLLRQYTKHRLGSANA